MTFSFIQKSAKDTWDTVKKKPTILLVPSMIELLFSVIGSVVVGIIQLHILRNLYEIFQLIDVREIAALPPSQITDQAALLTLLKNKEAFMFYYSNVLKLLLTLLVSIYIIWTVFQSINWYLANRAAKNSIKYSTYLARFSTVTVAWILIAAGLFILSIRLLMYTGTPAPLISTDTATVIIFLAYAILAYFAFISYSIAHRYRIKHIFQKTFRLSYHRFLPLVIMFIAALIPTFIIGTLIYTSSRYAPWIGAVIFIITIPPYNFMKKIFYLRTVKQLSGKN